MSLPKRKRTVAGALLLLFSAAPLRALEAPQSVAAGERFEFYRAPAELIAPLPMRVRVAPRGSMREVELISADEDRLYVYMTAFRLRRAEALPATLAESLSPCPLSAVDPNGDFERRFECAGQNGLNELQRELRIKRVGDLLLLAYIAWRKDESTAADALRSSFRWRQDFYVPAQEE